MKDVAVVGVPNQEWGEEVWAAVQPTDPAVDAAAVEAELRAMCHERLARFKCPRRFPVRGRAAAGGQRQAVQAPPP